MPVTEELIAANTGYAARFALGHLALPPARKVAIVTCMDARLIPSRALGLEEGDAHVIRNAGGLARDALRSLVISQQLLGTREIVVIHHTECGMLTFTNDQLQRKVRTDLGADASAIDFQPFADVEQSVVDDVRFLRESSLLIEGVPVRGFVYDVHTGRITEVQVPAAATVP
jgi:carbonic anhydrase